MVKNKYNKKDFFDKLFRSKKEACIIGGFAGVLIISLIWGYFFFTNDCYLKNYFIDNDYPYLTQKENEKFFIENKPIQVKTVPKEVLCLEEKIGNPLKLKYTMVEMCVVPTNCERLDIRLTDRRVFIDFDYNKSAWDNNILTPNTFFVPSKDCQNYNNEVVCNIRTAFGFGQKVSFFMDSCPILFCDVFCIEPIPKIILS